MVDNHNITVTFLRNQLQTELIPDSVYEGRAVRSVIAPLWDLISQTRAGPGTGIGTAGAAMVSRVDHFIDNPDEESTRLDDRVPEAAVLITLISGGGRSPRWPWTGPREFE